MQMAIIEQARNILGYADANSEMNEHTAHPVVNLMEEQKTVTDKGGTMRLGAWKCDIKKIHLPTKFMEKKPYLSVVIAMNYNNAYVNQLENAGLISSGVNPETGLVRNCRD
jgi:CTP synthase